MASLSDETRHLSLGCFFTAPFVGGDYWTRTSDLLRVKEFAENSLKPMRRSWLRVLIFRILQHFLQMVARIRRNLPDEATVYDTTAL